jgi:hypothetical protein
LTEKWIGRNKRGSSSGNRKDVAQSAFLVVALARGSKSSGLACAVNTPNFLSFVKMTTRMLLILSTAMLLLFLYVALLAREQEQIRNELEFQILTAEADYWRGQAIDISENQ